MDTELLKTFLEVNRTRHFGKAAEHLFLTQSAVSARVRLLEDLIGTPLFTRARNNVQLTAQGERLVRHAETILTEHVYDQDFDLDSNVIEVYIRRLREKLGKGTIETRRGQGYVFRG